MCGWLKRKTVLVGSSRIPATQDDKPGFEQTIYISFWDSPTLSHLVEMAKYDPVWLIWRKHKQRFSLSKLRNSGDFLSISLDAILQTTSDNQIYKLVTLVISLLFITPMD